MHEVADTARTITEGAFGERIPVRGDDEIAELARSFNGMVDRLELTFDTQRTFISDAGHELLTDVTTCRPLASSAWMLPSAVTDVAASWALPLTMMLPCTVIPFSRQVALAGTTRLSHGDRAEAAATGGVVGEGHGGWFDADRGEGEGDGALRSGAAQPGAGPLQAGNGKPAAAGWWARESAVRPFSSAVRSAPPYRPVMRVATLSDTPMPDVPDLRPPWPGSTVTLPSVEVNVRRTPPLAESAEPALYVHGLGGAATNWTDLAGLLATRLDGQAVDLSGFGHSPPPPRGDYSVAAHVRTVTELIELGGRPVHLLGNSLGGLVSIVLAATRPDLVRTLTLISPALPGARVPARSDPLLPLLLLPGASRVAQRRIRRLTPEERARQIIALCFADPSRVPAQRLAEATDAVARRAELPWVMDALTSSLRGLAAYYLRPGRTGPWRLAARIAAPTLVIWGQQDRLVHVSLAARLARTVPDARLLVLPDVGHTAQLEDPRTTARAVLALLDESAPGAG